MVTPRKPDYILSIKVKDTPNSRKCGVAWKNDAGGISIQLDPCTVISWRDNVFIGLFPEEYFKKKWGDKSNAEKGEADDGNEAPF